MTGQDDKRKQRLVAFRQKGAARVAAFQEKTSDRVEDTRPADPSDWIQSAVIARAAKLDLTSYAIAKLTGGAVSEDHVRDYLTRRKSMGSHKLQHCLRVLGLTVRAE